ncbi:alkaline phosphatase family protein [Thiocystis violascens]|nr:alkaline phosphatase family protein [Thiocystis violascens]
MSSILQARGGHSGYPVLDALPVAELARATNLILLVIDGLGADWLARHSPNGILNRARRGTLSSVFPSTTAAAITTYLTGDAPLQHGLTGWHTYLSELGCVMTVLPGKPRYGGVPYRQAGIDPVKLFGHASVFDRIQTRSVIVSPHFIARSDFNLAHAGRAKILAYDGLRDLFRQTLRAIRPPRRWRQSGPSEPNYLYLYWPALDTIGHEHGMESTAAVAHLVEIEQVIEDFSSAAAGTDSLLLISADHGQIDTTPQDNIDLADHPELADCLLLPLCGEPRAAFCYVRADHARVFEDYCQHRLKDRVDCVHSRQLVADGLFGFGTPHPRFMGRVGDYCLLPRGNGVIRDHLPSETPHAQIGVHGGLSEEELMVPLCVLAV